MMYAIVKTGGKQYKVKKGDIIKIEKIPSKEKGEIELNQVLLVFNDKTQKLQIGTPILEKAKIQAKVKKQSKGKKINVIKYKPKIRYKKKFGARQHYTEIKILDILIK